jgi:hypothetical protein
VTVQRIVVDATFNEQTFRLFSATFDPNTASSVEVAAGIAEGLRAVAEEIEMTGLVLDFKAREGP